MPVLSIGHPLRHLQKRVLALEANHAVELRNGGQDFFVAQTGIVAARADRACDTVCTQKSHELPEVSRVVLKNDGEADQQRIGFSHARQNVLLTSTKVNEVGFKSVLGQYGGKITKAQVVLIFVAY